MLFRKTFASLLLLTSAPVAAQPMPPAPPAAPSAWTVTADELRGTVEIAATGKGGAVEFAASCSKYADRGLVGTFSGYRGGGLRTDGQIEHVAFYARGSEWQDAFAVQLRYSAARGGWEFVKPLSPVFLSSFSRGATLAVVNSRNEEIFSFDLTGSTTATKAIRSVCGFD